jgi:hypothetical protein
VAVALAARDIDSTVEGSAVNTTLAGAAAAGLEVGRNVEALVAGLVVVGAEEVTDLAHALVGLAHRQAATPNVVVDRSGLARLDREVDAQVTTKGPSGIAGRAVNTVLTETVVDANRIRKRTAAAAELISADREGDV